MSIELQQITIIRHMKQYNILLTNGRALAALGYSRANAAMAATKAHGINPGQVLAVVEA